MYNQALKVRIFIFLFLDLIFENKKKMASSFSARKGMSRILDGIIKYRQTLRPSLLAEFQKVATGPSVKILFFYKNFSFKYSFKPEGLLLTCVDSRVVASRITQAVPGQLFIVRNPGTVRFKY